MTRDPGDYLTLNRENWDQRAPAHAASSAYALERFATDPGVLSDVVRFDRARLGDLAGARAVHLRCQFGTDTVSLSRLGARMTGLDFSSASLTEARSLAERAGAQIDFSESDVSDALAVLSPASFDLVYTGIGALCWLPLEALSASSVPQVYGTSECARRAASSGACGVRRSAKARPAFEGAPRALRSCTCAAHSRGKRVRGRGRGRPPPPGSSPPASRRSRSRTTSRCWC